MERHITATLKKYKFALGFILYAFEGEKIVTVKKPLKSSNYASRELLSECIILEKSVRKILKKGYKLKSIKRKTSSSSFWSYQN